MAAPQNPTYFLPPNWTTPAVGGPIRLGNLLKQPLLPHRSILTVGEDDTDFPGTYSFEETDWQRELSNLFDAQIKLEASLSGMVKNMVRAGSSSSGTLTLTAGKVKTIVFEQDPTREALVRWLSDKRVQQVVHFGRRPTVLYMVSGIKIATDFQAQRSTKNARSAAAEFTAPVAAAAGVDVGAGGSVARERGQEGRSVAQTETILGYQLLEIRVRGEKISTNEYRHDAAFLNDGPGERSKTGLSPDAVDFRCVSTLDQDSLDTVAKSLQRLDYEVDADQWDSMNQFSPTRASQLAGY